MSLSTDANSMVMPVAPFYGGGNGGGGFLGDGNGWWILLLFILLGAGGFGGWGGNGGAAMPFMMNNTNNDVQRGFDQSAIMGGLNGIQSGIAGLAGQVSTGFSGVEIAANSRQMADMNQMFGLQTAITGGLTNLSQQFANCCCENRLATCQTQNIVQNEGAATRLAIQNQTQAILDKLCQQELAAKDDRIAELERQLTMANLQASQVAQTSALIADNTAQTQYIVNRVAPYPIPAYTVANPVTPATGA